MQLWAHMGKYLRAAEVGHCDLQHGNVLLVPGATPNSLALKLIDYDGMWVPALAGKKSGEVGHANYQHPQRLREGTYSLEVDRFPLLLVATAMRALKADKGLWAKYDNGDNMLFKESDLAAPGRSELFEELSSLPDPGLVMLAAQVRAALKGSLESAALLEDVMPEAKAAPASAKMPRPAVAPPSGVTKRKSVPVASPVAVAPAVSAPAADALAFEADETSAPSSFVRKKKRGKEKSAGVLSRLPLAAWIGGGAALALVVAVVGGLAVWALAGKSNPPTPIPPDNRVVQKEAGASIPPVARPDPGKDKDRAALQGRSGRAIRPCRRSPTRSCPPGSAAARGGRDPKGTPMDKTGGPPGGLAVGPVVRERLGQAGGPRRRLQVRPRQGRPHYRGARRPYHDLGDKKMNAPGLLRERRGRLHRPGPGRRRLSFPTATSSYRARTPLPRRPRWW